MDTVRTLLVDDHALFRDGLASLMADHADFEVVGEAGGGEEALEKARKLEPDLILMDIYMPGGDGLTATRRIKEEMPSIKIVVLTISEEDDKLFEAIKSGAQGYLLKKTRAQQFIEMLRGVSRGEAPISHSMAAKILAEFARQAPRDSQSAPGVQLSPREGDVLELLTRGATNKEIASALGISENTVKNRLKSILEKLHLENRVQAVAYALEKGLVKRTPPA
ncbi:MAG: response regulator [Candidatus Methylomirabilales bacterium]